MAYGFLVKNTSGSTQVDELYKNLCVVASGTVTQASPTSGAVFVGPTYTGTAPLIAFSCSELFVGVAETVVSGNTWTYHFRVPGWVSGSFTIKWWIFDVPPSASLPSFGLVVRNTSGDITFRSDYNYLRVSQILTPSWNLNVQTWTLTSGREYAIIMSGNIFASWNLGPEPPFNNLQLCSAKINSNVISQQWRTIANFYAPFAPVNTSMLVVDVTNY